MEQADRDTIQRNIVRLSSMVDVEALYRELIHRGVIDHHFIERIRASYRTPQEQAQEFFMNYTKRGPQAFQILVDSLETSGHISEANILRARGVSNGIARRSVSNSEVSSTTTGNGTNGHISRNEAFNNEYSVTNSSSSNSPTSSTSVPSSPLVRHNLSRVEPLSGSNSPSSSCSSLSVSTTDQIRSSLTACTMDDQPALTIQVRAANEYNMGKPVHEAYAMMSRPRGYALIINNIEFLGDYHAKREGAEKDTIHLQQLLEQLGFEVMIRHNVKKMDLIHPQSGIIARFLEQFRANEVDACVVAIMSHGKEGHIRSYDPEDFRNPSNNYWHFYDEILKLFNNRYCQVLKGKPKIFIVQACQGERTDRGVGRTQRDGKDLTESTISSTFDWARTEPPDSLPETEDMVVCYSTVPGFVSNRDVEYGTWYIRSLCKVFMEKAWNTELLILLRQVGREMRSLTCEYGTKQMSSFHVLGFHFDFYFNPGLFADGLASQEDENFATAASTDEAQNENGAHLVA